MTGKYQRDTEPTGATRLGEDPARGVEAYHKRNNERVWQIIDAVQSVADESGAWMGEVALRWLLGRPGVASVLVGARTVEQLQQSLAVTELELTTDQLDRLTTVSAPGIPDYPYGMLERACGMTIWQELGTAASDDP